MRVLFRWELAAFALAGLPPLAWAQDYQTLTIAEAAYLHSGLAMQAMLRNSSLRQLPQVIMVCCTIWLVYRRATSPRPQPLAGIVAYLLSCGIIIALFWPEAGPRFALAGAARVVSADGTISWVAQETGMPFVNARDSGLVPNQLRGDAVVPRALDLILGAVTEMPLLLGRAISPDNLERPFGRVAPMKEFVEDVRTPPPFLSDLIGNDFVPNCYGRAVEQLRTADPDRGLADMQPWTQPMKGVLAGIRVNRYDGGFEDRAVTCEATYQSMETRVRNHVRNKLTAQGSNKARVVREYLGIVPRDQARIFIQAELQRQVEDEISVNAPNRVVNAKRALDATSFGLGAVTNFNATAPLKSTGAQIEKYLDRMSRFLGVGSFLVYWGPYVVGIAMFTTLAFFPVVLLWSLFPGQHFKPLINYFLVLIFVCSTPLWWAMVDAAAEVAYAQHPGGSWHGSPVGWTMAYTSYMVVTVIGIVMVPVMQGMLLFGTWRAIGGMWSA